jgi:hypothetical protein
VADEQTTQPDTTTSETTETVTDGAVAEATEQQAATDAEAGDEGATDAGKETSVLGGDVETEGEGAAEADEEATAGPPEKYELALEGIELDPEAVEAAEPVFRELNLSNEQANKLMPVAKDFAERTAERTLAQIVEAGAAQKKEWFDAFKADPEIGGAKSEETEHLAAKGLDALGYPQGHDFRKALTETGFGNHPEMIRVFRRIGEMVGEDGFVRPDGAKQSDQPTESRWYGKKGD